jgi:hypothetical protein
MNNNKLYKVEILPEGVKLSDVNVNVNSKLWRQPRTLTLENLGGLLSIAVSDGLEERNVTSVEYVNQSENPTLPPETFKVNTRTHIAIDENYLYVWVQSLNKWKRCLLSNWI